MCDAAAGIFIPITVCIWVPTLAPGDWTATASATPPLQVRERAAKAARRWARNHSKGRGTVLSAPAGDAGNDADDNGYSSTATGGSFGTAARAGGNGGLGAVHADWAATGQERRAVTTGGELQQEQTSQEALRQEPQQRSCIPRTRCCHRIPCPERLRTAI